MAGLFDPAMFQQNPGAGDYSGLLARVAQLQGGGIPMPMPRPPTAPGAPGMGAMASGIIPPQGPPMTQQAPPVPSSGMGMQGPQQGGGFMEGLGNFLRDNRTGLAGITQFIGGGGLNPQLMNQGMNQDYQRNMQQGSLASTYQALIQSGIPAAEAQAMALNPELLKTLAPQHFAKPTFGVIGQSPTGIPQYGWINSNTQQTTPAGAGAGPPGGQGTGVDDPSLTGPAFVDAVRNDPRFGAQKADLIEGIVQGRLPYPSGMILKTPYGQWLQGALSQADQGLNAQTYQQRQKAFNDWYGGGKDQSGVQQVRQAADHGVALVGSLERNGNYPGGALVNKPLNEIGDLIGTNVEYGPAKLNVHALADELSKIWRGGGNSDSEVHAWEAGFPVNGTLSQQRAAVGKAAELYEGGIKALERKHQDSFGAIASTLPPIIDPQAGQAIAAMKAWAAGGKAAPTQGTQAAQAAQGIQEGATATHAKTGQKIVFKSGQWVPVGAAQ